jgi:hypothetical protein
MSVKALISGILILCLGIISGHDFIPHRHFYEELSEHHHVHGADLSHGDEHEDDHHHDRHEHEEEDDQQNEVPVNLYSFIQHAGDFTFGIKSGPHFTQFRLLKTVPYTVETRFEFLRQACFLPPEIPEPDDPVTDQFPFSLFLLRAPPSQKT